MYPLVHKLWQEINYYYFSRIKTRFTFKEIALLWQETDINSVKKKN
jgi:hypothetical protein